VNFISNKNENSEGTYIQNEKQSAGATDVRFHSSFIEKSRLPVRKSSITQLKFDSVRCIIIMYSIYYCLLSEFFAGVVICSMLTC
jgi:hypothetical protein